MKNLKEIAKLTEGINQKDRNSWIKLFYSMKDDAVYSTEGEGRFLVTNLISANKPEDIRDVVERWKRM